MKLIRILQSALFAMLGLASTMSWAANAVTSSLPATQVMVQLDNQPALQLDFPIVPRADQLVNKTLKQLKLSSLDINWQSSALFDETQPQTLKQDVLMRLANEEDFAAMELKPFWRLLRKQIHTMRFGTRVFTPIDPDVTAIDSNKNPNLKGKWLLELRTNETQVYVFGAVYQSGKFDWQQRKDAKYYAAQAGLLTPTVSELTVIQPDGVVETHSVEYWNRHFQEVAPGATIYVPMPNDHSLFNQSHTPYNTNSLVIELLRNTYPL
ncbi:capsule biosynthesis GfcC family protein [Vibrio tritonius]|uniref:capsule biosynthesis GfcC family protein n=1 Tax=Vibrio tritonius TaxID=1435069 RepID=UPI0008383AB1|nr:capsule biosynthesis GfcC family protein [Vibrio tritonius]